MNPIIQRALEAAPGYAVVEGFFFAVWTSRTWVMMRKGFQGEPFDHGPWWSVWFFRIWAVFHLPVLLLQASIHWAFKKPEFRISMPLVVASLLLHGANFLLVVAIYLLAT